MSCRAEKIHPVTFEVAESIEAGQRRYQARLRMDGIVVRALGHPQATEADALNVIAEFAERRR